MANHDQTTTATTEGIYSLGTEQRENHTALLKVDQAVYDDLRSGFAR